MDATTTTTTDATKPESDNETETEFLWREICEASSWHPRGPYAGMRWVLLMLGALQIVDEHHSDLDVGLLLDAADAADERAPKRKCMSTYEAPR